jgi:hypothetical protein
MANRLTSKTVALPNGEREPIEFVATAAIDGKHLSAHVVGT